MGMHTRINEKILGMKAFKQQFILLIFIAGMVIVPALHAQNLKIYQIDVEQADATLIIAPNGKTLLIDSGKNPHGNKIEAILKQENIKQIDVFVCTHYDEDHLGGIDEIAKGGTFKIVEVFDRGEKDQYIKLKTPSKSFNSYEHHVGFKAQQLDPGESIDLDSMVKITCVASNERVTRNSSVGNGIDENDKSIALLLQFGNFEYFTGGDIAYSTERKIAEKDLVTDVDVCKADHHGSHLSSDCDFMEELNPTVIIISNGSHNGFQHPRKVTLQCYKKLSAHPTVFQTNKYIAGGNKAGNVPDQFIADPESTDEDGTILVDVNLAQNCYEVKYRTVKLKYFIKNRIQKD